MTQFATNQAPTVAYRNLKFGDIYFVNDAMRQKIRGSDHDVSLEEAIFVPKPGEDDEVVYVKRIVATL